MTTREERLEATRRSWNVATANHNAHKGDQAAWLRAGGDTLFPEELELLGDLEGRTLVHLQCNAGQDSLCLARRGAAVTGVDMSDVAVGFARGLSEGSGIPARFVRSEVITWMNETDERFDRAFASYGVIGWHEDVAAWMAGAARVLAPGGRLVVVEFHPLVWSLGPTLGLDGDDYFFHGPYEEPVGDYVAELTAPGLGVDPDATPGQNPEAAYGWQHTFAEIVEAVIGAGLRIERLVEYPFSNGHRANPMLVLGEGRRWVWPEGRIRLPLMYGLAASRE